MDAMEKWTYARLLSSASQTIFEAPLFHDWLPDEARRQARSEAEQLVCQATAMTKLQLVTQLQDEVSSAVVKRVLACSADRKKGTPLAYILGETHFYGRRFAARNGVLIPRPDTEMLVDAAIHFIRDYVPEANVVDLGTGTGCIAISIAAECPSAHVSGVDMSQEALTLASDNAKQNAVDVDFIHADMRAWLPNLHKAVGSIEVLVSNPPYIPASDLWRLDESVRHHEPSLALLGGDDGLDFYRLFANLHPNEVFSSGPAAVFLEVGEAQAGDVQSLFRKEKRWADFTADSVTDLRGVERVVRLVRI